MCFFFWTTWFQLCFEPRSPGSKSDHVLFKEKRLLNNQGLRSNAVVMNKNNQVKQLFFLIFFFEQFKLITTGLNQIFFLQN